MPVIKLTAAQRIEIVRRYGEGESNKVLAAEYDISNTYVSRLAADAGIQPKQVRDGSSEREPVFRVLASGKRIRYTPPEWWLNGDPKRRA